MINFRFHLVSLIAVFLALGLGILVGSSVVDRVIVDRLDGEIKATRAESNDLKERISAQEAQIARDQDFLEQSTGYAVRQRLQAVPVALVAERGVDENAVNDVLATLRESGANVPGVMWLTDRWRLDNPDDLTELQDVTGVSGNNATARADALALLASRLSNRAPSDGSADDDLLETLRAAGFVDLSDGKRADFLEFPTRPARVLFLTGTDSQLNGSESVSDLVQALVDEDAPTVVGEVYDDHDLTAPVPQRGATVTPVRGDAELKNVVSTLDDAEILQGRLAAVAALEGVASGTVGLYGYGEGAQSPLPPRPS
jgi:hypothetical protein